MPRRSDTPEEAEKSHRLSLAALAGYDDVCTDVMIDNAFFKWRIRKNRNKHIPVRGVKDEDVPKIILDKIIVKKDVAGAEKAFLKLPGMKRYRSTLRSKAEQEQFLRHFRKYVYMYQTDCPWEVSTTNRYTITTYEAAVTARKRIKTGETIKYLTGTLVPLTTEESADLDLTQRNFSIVVSSRKKNSSIFLGPARFANHDCDANGRLVTRGGEGMEVIAMKNIEVGDEITVSYGDDYFGPLNAECLCHTCEALERNGWTSKDAFGVPRTSASTPPAELSSGSHLSQRKRRYDVDEASDVSSAATAASKKQKLNPTPSKLQRSWTPPASSTSDVLEANPTNEDERDNVEIQQNEAGLDTPISDEHDTHEASNSNVGVLLDIILNSSDHLPSATSPSRPEKASKRFSNGRFTSKAQRLDRMTARLLGHSPPSKPRMAPLSPPASSVDELPEAPAASALVGENANVDAPITIKIESVEQTKIETDADTIVVQCRAPEVIADLEIGKEADTSAPQASTANDLDSGLQDTPVSQSVSTLTTTTIVKRGPGRPRKYPRPSEASSEVLPSVESQPSGTTTTTSHLTIVPVSSTIRIPGDYVLTRKLIAQPFDRWVQCRNTKCLGYSLQSNGYQTRRECPRCERHSILYGFPWPKTDPDPRALLERRKEKEARSAYSRAGKSGKGTWVEGGGDPEERVMDHRTVHRFLFPDEEREITRKGLLREAEERRMSGRDIGTSDTDITHSQRDGTEAAGREARWSSTPDDFRRRSNRFVREIGVYSDR